MLSREQKVIFILAAVSFSVGILYGSFKMMHIISKEMKQIQKRQDLFEGLYRPINEWFAKEQAGRTLEKYLQKKQYKRIGVYGMGNLANRIYDALDNSNIKIVCCIDENNSFYSDVKLITLHDEFPKMDALIVTDYHLQEENLNTLKEKGSYDLLFLEDIIFNEL